MTGTLISRNGMLWEIPPGYPQEPISLQSSAETVSASGETNWFVGGLILGFVLGAFVFTPLGRELASEAQRRASRKIREKAGLKK